MKPPWVADEGLKYFPTLGAIMPVGKTYIMGEYSSELLEALPLNSAQKISYLPDPLELEFEFRNLIITDLATAYSIFWKKQNSKIRNFATNSLIIPTKLNWLQMNWTSGFSSHESNGADSWRWNIGEGAGYWGVIEILNRSSETRLAKLSFSIEDNFIETPRYIFSLNRKTLAPPVESGKLFFELSLEPGSNVFEISIANQVTRDSEIDSRLLNYRILNLMLRGDLLGDGENDFWMRWKLHESGYESVQEISQSGVITCADGFFNEPIKATSATMEVTNDRLSWYLAKAVRG
jgi:hypothetical protein